MAVRRRTSMYKRGAKGQAILQIIGVAALIGIMGGVVTTLSNRSTKLSARMRDTGTFSLLKSQSQNLSDDPGFWATQLRKYDKPTTPLNPVGQTFAQCLNPSAAGPWSCPTVIPATTITDSHIKTLGTGKYVSTVWLTDMHGVVIAGTEAQPLYFDSNGLDKNSTQCPGGTSNPNCKFQAVGYMIRDNIGSAVTSPGNVTLVRKISQTAHTVQKGVVPLAPVYEEVNLQNNWMNPGGNGVPVGAIMAYSGSGAVPTGFLLADGSLVAMATYPQLYSVIGTTWGPISGANFRLPDLRNLFLRGAQYATANPAAVTSLGPANIQTAGTRLTTSDVGPHNHMVTGNYVNGSASGTATASANIAALFGGWATAGASGGSASGGSDWFMPMTAASPVASFTAHFTLTPPLVMTIAGNPTRAGTSAVAGDLTESRPINRPTVYIIRADY